MLKVMIVDDEFIVRVDLNPVWSGKNMAVR